jgi:hypothetical protein
MLFFGTIRESRISTAAYRPSAGSYPAAFPVPFEFVLTTAILNVKSASVLGGRRLM